MRSDILFVEDNSTTNPHNEISPTPRNEEHKMELPPRLGSLTPPYQVYKKKNSDTLVAIKNKTDTLKYLLTYTMDEVYPSDTLTFSDLLRSIFTPKR